MAISLPDISRSRLFWTTVCTIIATVVSGVLVFYFTQPKSDTIGEPNKPAEKLEMNYYSFPGNLFDVNFPSLIGGAQKQFINEQACGCEIGVSLEDGFWENSPKLFTGKFNFICIMVGKRNFRIEKAWVDLRANMIFKKTFLLKREIIYQQAETRKEPHFEYYEVYHKVGIPFFRLKCYTIFKSEVRNGLRLTCIASIGKKDWKKLRYTMRESIQGIKWSPEAITEAFQRVKKKKEMNSEE